MDDQQYLAEAKIALKDYINVVLRRKWVIAEVFLASMITAVAISFIAPKTYEASAVIGNGFMGQEIIRSTDSIDIITSNDNLQKAIEGVKAYKSVFEFRKALKVESVKDTNYVKITVQARSAKLAKDLCENVANVYLAYGNDLYRKQEQFYRAKLVRLHEQTELLKQDEAAIENNINELSSTEGIILPETMSKIILLRNILSSCREQMRYLDDKKSEAEMTLLTAKEFRIVNAPIEPPYTIKPNKRQNVIGAGVIGLFLGVFLAFFMEFWQENN